MTIHAQRPVQTAAPAATPVSLAEAKAHLRVDFDDDDTLISALIDSVTAHLDGRDGVLGRALVTQTWRADFDGFASRIDLPLHPVASIVSVTYVDGAGATQTLSTTIYGFGQDSLGGYIYLKADQTWPDVADRPDAVSVTFIAGVAADDPALAGIRAAMLMMIGDLYENRESAVVGASSSVVPMAPSVWALLRPYRRVGL